MLHTYILKLNKLLLNIKKTNFIIFHSRQRCVISDINISIDGVLIEKATHTKFLGVVLSEDLTWNEHLKVLLSKVNKNFGVLRKLSYMLPSCIINKLYNSLILPYTDYCNIVWLLIHLSYLINYIESRKNLYVY